jgi:hypothetical protein
MSSFLSPAGLPANSSFKPTPFRRGLIHGCAGYAVRRCTDAAAAKASGESQGLRQPALAHFSQGAQGFLAGSTLRHLDQLDRLTIYVHLSDISVDGKHTAYVFHADINVIPSEVCFVIWQNILYV